MNLSQMQADVYRRMGFLTIPAPDIVTRITSFINEVHNEVISNPVMSRLLRRQLPFATVANSPYAALPQAVDTLHTIVDRSNQLPLSQVSESWIRESDPGRSFTSSTPQAYNIVDYASPVARQPLDSSQLYIQSSDASDTAQTAYIEVVTATGYMRAMSVTLAGASAIPIGPSDTLQVIDFYLNAAAAGEVTLTEDSGAGTELCRIGIGRTKGKCTLLEIYPVPASVIVLWADVDLIASDLVNSNDELLIPDKFCYLVLAGVRQLEYEKREKPAQAKDAEKAKNRGIAKLQLHMHRSTPTRSVRFSQLGPYFGDGS